MILRSYFNPRSPCGERRHFRAFDSFGRDISIHAPRAGSDVSFAVCSVLYFSISIHAPRAGSDDADPYRYSIAEPISIHAPRAGSDVKMVSPMLSVIDLFQSTLPVRGATGDSRRKAGGLSHFNPRSPCGERPVIVLRNCERIVISIHAPRAGSDGLQYYYYTLYIHFNPRSPCGERHLQLLPRPPKSRKFQSTLPVRGATVDGQYYTIDQDISIHAPRAGSDAERLTRARESDKFQSTLPVRGATAIKHNRFLLYPDFNPRSPCGERL